MGAVTGVPMGRAMIVVVDPASPLPPYEQVRGQIAALILGGQLAPDVRLPTVRQLAADLALAPGTVARAYRELEDAGLIETRGRHGTRVSHRLPTVTASEKRRRVSAAAAEFLSAARGAGASDTEIEAQIRALLGG